MIEGKTSTGFEYSVTEGIENDWRIVQAFRKATDGDYLKQIDAAGDLVEIILNDHDQEKALYEHIAAGNGGRVPTNELFKEIKEIIEEAKKQSNAIKN